MELHSTIIGKGQPFLILHGFLGMSDNWKTLGKKYADEGYEVHLIDQRNHGRSPHSHEFSYSAMSRDLKAYCEQHHLKNIILLGHSMGGKTAMFTATLFPDLIDKLIIVDIAPRYYAPHHQEILQGLKAIDDAKLSSRGEAEELLGKYVPDEGTRLFLLKNLYWKKKNELQLRMNLDVLTGKVENLGEELSTETNFDKETLFIKGEKSSYISAEDEAQIKAIFSKSKIVGIPDAGHWVHAENMNAFFEETLNFIQE